MNEIFDWCVKLLEDWAKYFGTTYKAINVWIFCVIEPVIFMVMCITILRQYQKLKHYKRQARTK